MSAPKPLKLDAKAAKAFDKYKSEAAKFSKARKHDTSAKAAKDEFAGYMGEATLAELPDGRLITRTEKTQHRGAQAAKDISWNEFNELPTAA